MRLSRGSPGHQPRDARPTSFATAAHWAGAAFETNRLLINVSLNESDLVIDFYDFITWRPVIRPDGDKYGVSE